MYLAIHVHVLVYSLPRKRPGSGVKKNTGSNTKVEMDVSLSDVEATPTKKRV